MVDKRDRYFDDLFGECFKSDTDPDGWYTGTNLSGDDLPVQDADDL